MISESAPWRDELRKSSARLLRWDKQKKWTTRTYFLAERDVMMGAYSIRRLIDSDKSSPQLPNKRLEVRRYALVGRKPMLLDRFSPELLYDVNNPVMAELSVARLCNQIIHSFVFQIYLKDDSTTSVVFVSDFDRDRHLNGISFRVLAEIFDYVGREEILRSSGSVRAGVTTMTNITNHDAVESGQAHYSTEERVGIEWDGPSLPVLRKSVLAEMLEAAKDTF